MLETCHKEYLAIKSKSQATLFYVELRPWSPQRQSGPRITLRPGRGVSVGGGAPLSDMARMAATNGGKATGCYDA